MEIALALMSLVTGLTAGVVGFDMIHRKAAMASIIKFQEELKAEAAKLASLHNSTVEQFRGISDKVSAHEMIIKSGHRPLK